MDSIRTGPLLDDLRFAVGTLTVLPVRTSRVDRATAGHAMAWAPLVGLLIGLLAGAAGSLASWLGLEPLPAAAVAVTCLAAVTRSLHLDGLADTADGLGSGRPAPEALRIMKMPDIGPFGVVTVALVLLLQVAALAEAWAGGNGFTALIVAAVAGRTAVLLGCLPRVPAARPDGLGALVAGTTSPAVLATLAGVVTVGATVVAGLRGSIAVLAGLGVAAVLLHRCVRRFGGVTGDVLGALIEVATVVALLILATG